MAAFACFILFSCGPEQPAKDKKPAGTQVEKRTPLIPFTVVNKFPHDTTAYTEGFLFHNNLLMESTGAPEYLPYARSTFGFVDLETGKLNVKVEIDKQKYFGEGIVVLNNLLYQLTYTNQVGFLYDAKTFQKKGQFNYANKEGWGLTTDGKYLIMSDGTNILTFLDPIDQKVIKTLQVSENGYASDRLNELEFIKGYIYANLWMTNTIVKIDPTSGQVVEKMEMDELVVESRAKHKSSLEMNGIAYDSINDKVLVTGKFWPYIYEIKFNR
ncbi:MAG: glutaminyl-peptide cyclotransferase [Bacteroidia bacterium]|nr:glutaminyl-peptide cyclotransferase [Bacteroidia bacterium]